MNMRVVDWTNADTQVVVECIRLNRTTYKIVPCRKLEDGKYVVFDIAVSKWFNSLVWNGRSHLQRDGTLHGFRALADHRYAQGCTLLRGFYSNFPRNLKCQHKSNTVYGMHAIGQRMVDRLTLS